MIQHCKDCGRDYDDQRSLGECPHGYMWSGGLHEFQAGGSFSPESMPCGECGLPFRASIHIEARQRQTALQTSASPEAKTKRPRFSILHTSARPEKWREIYDAWLSNCDQPEDVEYVLVVDERWGFAGARDQPAQVTSRIRDGRLGSKPWWGASGRSQDKLVWNEGRRCYVEGVNIAAYHATGDILIVVADDQFPCEHWDRQIFNIMAGRVDDEPWLFSVSTGTPGEFERGIVVMPIMSRALYEKWGYVFYPEYESMYADNDLCEHAKQDGVLIEARHLMFPHKHTFAKEPQPPISFADLQKWDEAYQAQNRPEAYVLGERLLKARRANKFGSLLSSARAKPGQKIAVCLPGEFFHHTWVNALLHLYQFLNRRFQHVSIFTAYTSAAYVTRAGLLKKMQEHGVDFDYVLWIDDDNILQPEQLALLLEDLEEHPELSRNCGLVLVPGR